MAVALNSRSALKEAGTLMAREAIAALVKHIETREPWDRSDERVDALVMVARDLMENTAASYRRLGISPTWISRFRASFLLEAGERCRAAGLPFRPYSADSF